HPQQKHALVVDSRRSRLYVFANADGRPRLIADYYVTLGKNGMEKTREGDQKTPIGVYHVTANLPRQKLTDFYGAGAFPINYPNEWDKRRGRNGHGIWLQGLPSAIYARRRGELGHAQAHGQCLEALDQGRPRAGLDVPLSARGRLRGGQLRAGLQVRQPLEQDAQAPVLGEGSRALENSLRGIGMNLKFFLK